MEMELKEFTISGEDGEPIRCDLRFRSGMPAESPAVIFCHGFKGFKDWGGWPYFRSRLAEAGLPAVGLNFSHNGIGEDPLTFSRPDLFKKDTLNGQLRDLNRVIEAARSGVVELTNRPLILCGHSRGGIAAISAAASRADISGLVLLAAVAELPVVSAEDEAKWRREGVWYVSNARTGQQLPLGLGLLEELTSDRERIKDAAQAVRLPAIIVHGDRDDSVPLAAAGKLNSWIKHSELKVIEAGDHNFGTRHPFAGSTEQFEQVIETVLQFVERLVPKARNPTK